MKPILTCYGGKQNIADWIIDHFPSNYQHLHYVEPFFGGGAVFFKKLVSKKETINDLDNNLYRFYRCVIDHPDELIKRMEKFICFESEYKRANSVIKGETEVKDEIEFAYYYWVLIFTSFSCSLDSGFRFMKDLMTSSVQKRMFNKISYYKTCFERIKYVTIFNRDSIKVIKQTDTKDSFFYLDPPYPDADQKYLFKYTKDDFLELIDTLKHIKGKFILSCYKKDWMIFPKSWKSMKKNIIASIDKVNQGSEASLRKETIILNYESQQKTLF